MNLPPIIPIMRQNETMPLYVHPDAARLIDQASAKGQTVTAYVLPLAQKACDRALHHANEAARIALDCQNIPKPATYADSQAMIQTLQASATKTAYHLRQCAKATATACALAQLYGQMQNTAYWIAYNRRDALSPMPTQDEKAILPVAQSAVRYMETARLSHQAIRNMLSTYPRHERATARTRIRKARRLWYRMQAITGGNYGKVHPYPQAETI